MTQKLQPQRVRDPVYNIIHFEASAFDTLLWDIINTEDFQRLRRIRQLGFTEFVYPGATHTRFAHSLGVYHTARKLLDSIREKIKHREPFGEQRALAAALVHDIGHGPFSHAFEELGKRFQKTPLQDTLRFIRHEDIGKELICDGEIGKILNGYQNGFAENVAATITQNIPGNIYDSIVSSQFDADRLDYMQRDRMMTGIQLGTVDFEWLTANLEIAEVRLGDEAGSIARAYTLGLSPKAIYAAESYVQNLFHLYPAVYYHKTARSAEKILIELLFRFFFLVHDGSIGLTGLNSKHPLTRYAQKPRNNGAFRQLDDFTLWGAMGSMNRAKDPLISELSKRLLSRRLFKCMDIRESIVCELKHNGCAEGSPEFIQLVDRRCAQVEACLFDWKNSEDPAHPRFILDRGERIPYKQYGEDRGPLNQILVIDGGQARDLAQNSASLRAMQPFRFFRAYFREEDKERVTAFIHQSIKESSR